MFYFCFNEVELKLVLINQKAVFFSLLLFYFFEHGYLA